MTNARPQDTAAPARYNRPMAELLIAVCDTCGEPYTIDDPADTWWHDGELLDVQTFEGDAARLQVRGCVALHCPGRYRVWVNRNGGLELDRSNRAALAVLEGKK